MRILPVAARLTTWPHEPGMSRSSFARRFKETARKTPVEYLERLPMLLAADRLENSDESIGNIAVKLGYESEGAFTTAFKRVMGSSPWYSPTACPHGMADRQGDLTKRNGDIPYKFRA
jgi:AraC-like DNA-binding protein